MPRIRKKTSNRGTTRHRASIKNKVRETRKKNAKSAKKNPQWKSKIKKDPGIPSAFPYKDQLLAEVAEQRRQVAEEKERRKAEKKGKTKSKPENDGNGDEPAADAEPDQDSDDEMGLGRLAAKRMVRGKAFSKPVPEPEAEPESDDELEVPALVNRDLTTLQTVLDEADVVIQILDARDPLSFRSSHLEELSKAKVGRETIFILNKIDCTSQEAVSSWLTELRRDNTTILFRAATRFLPKLDSPWLNGKGKAKAKDPLDDALGADAVLDHLGKLAATKTEDAPLAVAVVGFTNVGKSAFINSLSKAAALPVYSLASSSRGPTTTVLPQEMTVQLSSGKHIRLIDTPGISWLRSDSDSEEDSTAHRARDILLRNKGRIDRLKDPALPMGHLVTRANNEDLMMLYNLPAFSKGDIDAFLAGVSRSQQLVKKRGQLDIPGAAKIVLRDWSIGKLRWYCVPSAAAPSSGDALTPLDKDILETIPLRKDMRRAGGAVRLSPGMIDSRPVTVLEQYAVEDGSSDENASEDGDEPGDDLGASDDNSDEEDTEDGAQESTPEESDEEIDEPEVPEVSKAKRKRPIQEPLPPRKKVAFAEPKKAQKPVVSKTAVKKKPSILKVANTPKTKVTPTDTAADEYDFGKFF